MVKVKILTCNANNIFVMDSIYSALLCNDDEDGVMKFFSQLQDCNDEDICGILAQDLYLVHQGQPVNEYFIEKNLEQYNIILPYEEKISDEIIRRYYSNYDDYLDQAKKLIDEVMIKYPELTDGLLHVVESGFYIRPNIAIGYARDIRELYQCIVCIDECKNSPMMISLLIRSWIISNGIKVKTVDISDNSPEIWNCGYQKIEAVQKYVSAVLNDYILFRKKEGFSESFAGINPYQGDFGGKQPIWMCWWQGEEEMPELIKACIASVKRNAPENSKVILITLDNVGEYVTFTDSIIEKFNSKKISYTHLSDILRAELVYRYGGLWIDATYYIPHKMDESIFEENLFSIAFNKPLWGMDIMRGRWTLSVLGAQKASSAVQFLMEGLWFYWDNVDELVDYFLVDYVFDAGYRNFDDIQRDVDSIRRSSNAVYDLQLKMNQSFGDKDLEWLQAAADFYKLNRRNEYITESIDKKKTFYSYIVRGEYSNKDSDTENICIKCDTYVVLVKNIRAINPKSILDYSGYLLKDGRVSKGILTDFLSDNCVIHGCENTGKYTINGRCIYDSLIESRDEMRLQIDNVLKDCEKGIYLLVLNNYKDYDLIIVEK